MQRKYIIMKLLTKTNFAISYTRKNPIHPSHVIHQKCTGFPPACSQNQLFRYNKQGFCEIYIAETMRNCEVRAAEHNDPTHKHEPGQHLKQHQSYQFNRSHLLNTEFLHAQNP